jgi:hypothetical protein
MMRTTSARSAKLSAGFLRSIDGVFGPETARACSQAHWGSASRAAQAPPTAARWTVSDLLPRRELPKDYAWRKLRTQSAGQTNGKKSLAATQTVGDTEPPGSNRVEWASTWYG